MRHLIAGLLSCVLGLTSHSAATELQLEPVVSGLEHPWAMAFLPDGRMLVSERPGRLRLIVDGKLLAEPVAGLPPVYYAGQGGLLDILVDPDFAQNQRVYLSYAHGDAQNNATRVSHARLVDGSLLELEPIYTAQPGKNTAVHYGGRLLRLADGALLVTVGDGFDLREAAQDPRSDLGKIMRIPVEGGAASVYSLGHRNGQGLLLDFRDGSVLAHEHGPRGGDELNRITPGANYGWPLTSHGLDYSGAKVSPYTELPGMSAPLLHWTPSIAPAAMAQFDGPLFGEWRGDLIVAALAARGLRRVRLDGERVIEQQSLLVEERLRWRDVRLGPDGALWLLSDGAAAGLYRATPASR